MFPMTMGSIANILQWYSDYKIINNNGTMKNDQVSMGKDALAEFNETHKHCC